MAGFSTAGRNLLLGALPAAPRVSLHSADPGNTGAAELAGGGYARQTGALAAAAGGSRALTVAAPHTVPPGSTIAYVGLWSADDATFLGSAPVPPETYNAAGNYQVDPSTVTV